MYPLSLRVKQKKVKKKLPVESLFNILAIAYRERAKLLKEKIQLILLNNEYIIVKIKTMEKTKKKSRVAVAYLRVSTDEQANKGLSLDVQEEACKNAIEKDGFELLKVIKDEGQTGTNLKRAGIKEVISLVINKNIDAVYTISSDRLNRNTADYLYLRDLFRKNNVELRYVYQQNTDDSAVSRTTDTILATINEMQSLVTSEKVKKTLHAKATAGYFPSSAPLGYVNITNPDPTTNRFARKIIVPDPKMSPFITDYYRSF